MDNDALWRRELRDLANGAGVEPPLLRFVNKRTVGRFSPYSLLRKGHNACANPKGIHVTTDLLDVSPAARSYCLAHELAHLIAKHPARIKRIGRNSLFLCTILFMLIVFGHGKNATIAIMLVSAVNGLYMWLATRQLEFEADEIAVCLIGKKTAIEGCMEVGRLSTTLNLTRRTRIKKMQGLPDQKQ